MTFTRLQCREQMHAAERLARLGVRRGTRSTEYLLRPIEAAYMSPECEDSVARRIQVALDRIDMQLAA